MRLTLYEILDIAQDASIDTIRAAHRARFMLYHPQCNPGDVEAAKTFMLVNKAYSILFDHAERASYDALAKSNVTR